MLLNLASSGCSDLDDVIESTINPDVSVDEYHDKIKSIVVLPYYKEAVTLFKQCFLDQSKETLDNVNVMMNKLSFTSTCFSFLFGISSAQVFAHPTMISRPL
ncbi:hypothetical protein A6R68_10070 [Neotoma lepida]|uniref:Uncharacterized protein n=1 Tax=Neotoma lepida TaxID=56216 RepID=A0A1A6G013_NEOLE|nr:hypothetical protein A6R68_10070 [Neotoma lepida]